MKGDMKILLVTLEYPPQKGGVASYYGGLVEELKRQGHGVEVIFGGNNLLGWIWPRWLKAYFLVRKRLKMYGGKASGAPEALPLLFIGQVLPLGTVAYLLRKHAPYVVFTHGMDILMAQRSWRKRRLAQKILEHAKLIVANSEFTKGEILKLFSERSVSEVKGYTTGGLRQVQALNILVVYPCPNIATEVKPEDVEVLRRRLGLTGKKVLLTLGRVVERKGHDLVLKALPEILKHVPEAVYVVAGDGPYLGRLAELTQQYSLSEAEQGEAESKGILKKAFDKLRQYPGVVRFVGQVSEEEKPLYYAFCDLFVMPSRQIGPVRARVRLRRTTSNGAGPDVEGFGLSFLEAALFEKPSVGGRSGGISEAILDGKTGALVDPTDVAALARVVVQLLRNDTLRGEIGKNAKARVLHEFNWEKQAITLLKELKK